MIPNYPKVLLFGNSFDNQTGMGITLTNLFAEWPAENIAVMAYNYDKELCDRIRPCGLYLGNHKVAIIKKTNKQSLKSKIINIVRNEYIKLGIEVLRNKTHFCDNDLQLIEQFKPEIIFTALGSVQAMKSTMKLVHHFPKAKLVLYIVDDWVNTRCKEKYFSSFWLKKYDSLFRGLLSMSSGNLSICQTMTDAYRKRYGVEFIPFHNPVDLQFWNQIKNTHKYPNKCNSIVYLGKINNDTTPCLLDLAKIVNKLNEQGHNYVFDVYSPDSICNTRLFEGYFGCSIMHGVGHEEVPQLMKSYDSLFLPLGFSKSSRRYVRLSMPTKLTEYLASGRPTILYCPAEIALAKYVIENNCSIVCTEHNLSSLEKAVLQLRDSETCSAIVQRAMEVASEHDCDIVRKKFINQMIKFIEK